MPVLKKEHDRDLNFMRRTQMCCLDYVDVQMTREISLGDVSYNTWGTCEYNKRPFRSLPLQNQRKNMPHYESSSPGPSNESSQVQDEHRSTLATMYESPDETIQSAATIKRPVLINASSRLLGLPAELRVMIWEYALIHEDRVTPPDQSFSKIRGPKVEGIHLLRANKQIYDEAKDFLYKKATFELVFYLAKPPVNAQTVHIQRLPALISQVPINCPFWDKIEKLRVVSQPLAEGSPRYIWRKEDGDALVNILSAVKATITEFQIHLEAYSDILGVIRSFADLEVQGPVAFDIVFQHYRPGERRTVFAAWDVVQKAQVMEDIIRETCLAMTSK